VDKAGDSRLIAVLKADAYGHGAVQVAHTALLHGAFACAVACVPEARILREAGVFSPIIVLGYTPGWQAREAVSLGLTLSVFDLATATEFSKAARALDRPVELHVKVDTGMHRLGVPYAEAAELTRTVSRLAGVSVSGIFTHFAMADDLGDAGVAVTDLQKSRFDAVLADLDSTGDRPDLAHVANSAALLSRNDVAYDMVRPGIALYGLPPDPSFDVTALRAALSWKSQIAQVHDLQPGECVGYGHVWKAPRRSSVAVVPAGYADGFRRGPTTWEHVLVRGQRAPVVGRVSMDQMTVDVTGIDSARRGDEVVLIGSQGNEELPATTVAEWLGTSCYEVVAEILARVPRVNWGR
jgi:alanine racemase